MNKTQILIAEDDTLIAHDIKGRLESLGYGIAETTNRAEQAISLVQDLRPDLVLMDIKLPGEMDGIQAAEQIRSFHVPVVYVTGHCDGPMFERAKLSGPFGYILKPYQTRDLKTGIEMGLYRHKVEREREQMLKQLEAAMATVKALTGLLSICAYCKKIKENTGSWSEVEAYIMHHSTASFTHGMCPDCFVRVKKQLENLAENGTLTGSMVLG